MSLHQILPFQPKEIVYPTEVVKYLYDNNIIVNELKTDKIGLEEYYINLMKTKEVK